MIAYVEVSMNRYFVDMNLTLSVEAPGGRTAANDVMEALGVLVSNGLVRMEAVEVNSVSLYAPKSNRLATIFNKATWGDFRKWMKAEGTAYTEIALDKFRGV